MRITMADGSGTGVELDKRFYVPGVVLHDDCPKCQAPYAMDLGTEYLSYPVTGRPKALTAYCTACDHEWPLGRVIVRVSVEDADARPSA